MKRTSPTNPPTIQELILRRIKQQNLSRSEFIQAVGYTKNITRGLRRFDTFLRNLEFPNDDFLRAIITVLEIDGLSFYQSFMASKNVMAKEADDIAKNVFNPHIEILVNDSPSPSFAARVFYYQRRVTVPPEVLSLPIIEELSAVLSICKEHVETLTCENDARKEMIYGFKYHREHNFSLEFDTDCILKSIESTQAARPRKMELGDRFVDLMLGEKGEK